MVMHLDCRQHDAWQPRRWANVTILLCDLDLERRMSKTSIPNAPRPFDELAEAIKARRSAYGLVSGLRLDRAAPKRGQ
jgi:hypothetical protein